MYKLDSNGVRLAVVRQHRIPAACYEERLDNHALLHAQCSQSEKKGVIRARVLAFVTSIPTTPTSVI